MSVACNFSSRQFCLSHPVKCIPPSVLFLFWVMEIKLDLAAMLSALTVKHIATKCSGKMILGDRNYKRNSLHLESVMWNTCLSASTCCIQFVDPFKWGNFVLYSFSLSSGANQFLWRSFAILLTCSKGNEIRILIHESWKTFISFSAAEAVIFSWVSWHKESTLLCFNAPSFYILSLIPTAIALPSP